MTKPDATDYAPYYETYVSLIPDDDIVAALDTQKRTMLALLQGVDETLGNHRYEPSKWSVKEVVGHVIDAERAFAFRAFHFGRNHQTPLPAFDQDSVAPVAPFARLTVSEIAQEYKCVRDANLHLFRHFDDAAWSRRGVANQNEITVRALAYVIAGHERHHIQILKSRYL
jgi:hypothetical protein